MNNQWKQMSDQEQAEWLAGFCGWTYYPKREGEINCDAHWERPDNLNSPLYTFDGGNHLQDFFNSPAGFMAIVAQVREKLLPHQDIAYAWLAVLSRDDKEAFYEACYKAVSDD
jgi:hypothetical protein